MEDLPRSSSPGSPRGGRRSRVVIGRLSHSDIDWRFVVPVGVIPVVIPVLVALVEPGPAGDWQLVIAIAVRSVAWLIVSLRRSIAAPLANLVAAGGVAGAATVLLARLEVSVLVDGSGGIPFLQAMGIVALNVAWGGAIGLLVLAVRHGRHGPSPQAEGVRGEHELDHSSGRLPVGAGETSGHPHAGPDTPGTRPARRL